MSTPYQTPAHLTLPALAADELNGKRRFWKRIAWICGPLILLVPLSGFLAVGTHLARALRVLADTGKADPEELAHHISMAILCTLYSLILALPMLIGLVVAIVRLRRLRVPPPVKFSP